MDKRTLDIVICCYNRARLLKEALVALSSQTCQDFNVILSDDGSANLLNPTEYPVISKVVWTKDDGLYHRVGRFNEGLQCCVSDIVLLLDDDCIPQSDAFVEVHLKVLRDADVSRGTLRFPGGGHAGTWFSTANLCLKKSTMDQIGGFEQRYDGYYGFEDHDMGNRIKELGLSVCSFAPGTDVLHKGGSYMEGDRSEAVLGHNRTIFVEKWGYDPTSPGGR